MPYFIGIDTGGTFTDCTVVDDQGTITATKAASTPHDFASGVMDSLRGAAGRLGLDVERLLAETTRFGHGTTLATNTLLTHTGSRTGIITTVGHEDALHMGRIKQKIAGLDEDQIHNFLLHGKAIPGIVPRKLIRGIDERVDWKGDVVVPLNEEQVREAARALVGAGCEAIAICFLWSFMNPTHERRARELVLEVAPDVAVSISSEVSPVLGEYERGATTMLNAYLTRKVDHYLSSLAEQLAQAGLRHRLMVMLSNGGVAPAEEARRKAVYLLASGPAGGVIGARNLGRQLGYENVLTTDMGGTSFDVGLVVGGEPEFAREPVFDKYHLTFPMVDVVSIGAGGGSIAWIDSGGFLKVGPQSAGAHPGPVCYGLGGTEPTVTDANVVLGRLNPDYFLGGAWKLDRQQAERAIRERIAEPLALSVEEAAMGIIDILDARMADLVRRVTIGRGLDPRNFALFAIGGAGPLHVGAYARDVGVQAVVIPAYASEFSALAIGTAEMLVVKKVSSPMVGPFRAETLNAVFDRLEAEAIEELRAAGAIERRDGQVTLLRAIDMRYKGQVHEVSVPVPARRLSDEDAAAVVDRFHERYESRYGKGTTNKAAPVEALTFEVRVAARSHPPRIARQERSSLPPTNALTGSRPVYFRETGGFIATPIYHRDALHAGQSVSGPAVIEAPDTTILVHPGQRAEMDEYRNLVLVF